MKLHHAFLGLALTACFSTTSRAAAFFSNLGMSTFGNVTLNATNQRLASDFLTANSASDITQVTVSLQNSDSISHTILISIVTDISFNPGSFVGSFNSFVVPASQLSVTNVTGTSGGITLNANTKYWLVLQANEGFAQASLAWSYSVAGPDPGTTFSPVTFTSIKGSSDSGASYSDSAPGDPKFSLSGTVIPEPSSLALLLFSATALLPVIRYANYNNRRA